MNRIVKCSLGLLFLLVRLTSFSQPIIAAVNPGSGSPGTPVTITGNNFNTVASNNTVYFGAAKAVINSATANAITVTVPVGATYDYVEVMANGFSAYSNLPFVVRSGTTFTSTTFSTHTDHPTSGAYPSMIVRKDFDMDGRPDMAVSNFNSNNLSVFRNTSVSGTVSFTAVINYSTGLQPEGIAADDLNGDGKPDLIVTSISDHLFSVFINTSTPGNISFAARQDISEGPTAWPRDVITGDIDGDGLTDVITADNNAFTGTVSINRNTGTAGVVSFAPRVSYVTADYPRRVIIGDLDGDGKPELAVTCSSGTGALYVYKNNSTPGNINLVLQQAFPISPQAEGLEIGDIDGDGKAELLVSNLIGTNSISVFRNTSTTGLPSFATQQIFPVSQPVGFSVGDIDGDNKPDLAVTNFNTGFISVLKNLSTPGNIDFAPAIDYAAGNMLIDARIGDVDGDNYPDITVTNASSNLVSVLRFQGAVEPVLELGNDTTFCEGDSLILRANIPNAQYLWSTGAVSDTIIVKQSDTYWLRVTTLFSVLSDTVHITVNPQPLVDLGDDRTQCKGHPFTLDVFNTGAAYNWSNGSTLHSIQITQGGTYSVEVNLAGCIQKDTINILYDSLPGFSLGHDALLCEGKSIILDPKLSHVNFRWQDGSTNPTYTVTTPGTYSLMISNDCGSNSDDILIEKGLCELFMPNAFTPNNDGKNDRFGIKYSSFIKIVDIKIFNRWGEIVFQSTDPAGNWDGTFKGLSQPSGNYVWSISLTDIYGESSFHKGNVLLIR